MAGNGSQQRKPGVKRAVEDVKALATVLAMEAESILGRSTARVLGALALFAAVGGILVWYIAPSGAAEKQALVVTLAQILGGTALLSGLYFTWRTLQVNREGQITERFTRAIDQLGKVENGQKLFEIRIGGIYALERIARESEEDYLPIMEILTAYVRQNAPWSPEGSQGGRDDATAEQSALEGFGEKSETTEPPAPDPDIQAIMSVLRRRIRSYMHGEHESLDLHETNLSGANLSEANLSGANLIGAHLEGANLRRAHLERANLYRAHLEGAVLGFAHLEGALLGFAHLKEANLGVAHLEGADLGGAHLEGTNLYRAHLEGADLEGVESLTPEQIEWAIGDEETTKLPEYLVDHRPARWSKSGEEQDQIIASSGPNARLREETSEQG